MQRCKHEKQIQSSNPTRQQYNSPQSEVILHFQVPRFGEMAARAEDVMALKRLSIDPVCGFRGRGSDFRVFCGFLFHLGFGVF